MGKQNSSWKKGLGWRINIHSVSKHKLQIWSGSVKEGLFDISYKTYSYRLFHLIYLFVLIQLLIAYRLKWITYVYVLTFAPRNYYWRHMQYLSIQLVHYLLESSIGHPRVEVNPSIEKRSPGSCLELRRPSSW